jgi:hypothetical protein
VIRTGRRQYTNPLLRYRETADQRETSMLRDSRWQNPIFRIVSSADCYRSRHAQYRGAAEADWQSHTTIYKPQGSITRRSDRQRSTWIDEDGTATAKTRTSIIQFVLIVPRVAYRKGFTDLACHARHGAQWIRASRSRFIHERIADTISLQKRNRRRAMSARRRQRHARSSRQPT